MPVFRKLLPTERDRYAVHLLRLDRSDRYARFAGAVSESTIERHCAALDWARTLIVGCFADGELRGAAELCTDRFLWPLQAELAVSVEAPFQGRGAGKVLVQRALTIARNRGVERVHVLCLSENRRMRALALQAGGRQEVDGGEVAITIDSAPPSQFSLAQEALEDGAGMVATALDHWRLAEAWRPAA